MELLVLSSEGTIRHLCHESCKLTYRTKVSQRSNWQFSEGEAKPSVQSLVQVGCRMSVGVRESGRVLCSGQNNHSNNWHLPEACPVPSSLHILWYPSHEVGSTIVPIFRGEDQGLGRWNALPSIRYLVRRRGMGASVIRMSPTTTTLCGLPTDT